jgi:putative phosphoribosyl transferase
MLLDNRAAAGRELGALLGFVRDDEPIVLGLPRGGVVVAAEIAAALDAPLDVVLVRKIGVPGSPELALGAVGEDSVVVGNADVIRATRPTQEAFERALAVERAHLVHRARLYQPVRRSLPVAGRTVVLVDDGIATGATARAAIRVLRARGATQIVLAVPVVARSTLAALFDVADRIIWLRAPHRFRSVSGWYADFAEVGDGEVMELLKAGAPPRPGVPA